jgi:O-6-methylguanine DNA methyltransferase
MTYSSAILSTTQLETPLGGMTAIASEYGLFILTFQEETAWMKAKMAKYYPNASFSLKYQKVLDHTKRWIKRYFGALDKQPLEPLPPLDLQGSAFAKGIWEKLLEIPLGSTATYGDIARKLGQPTAARAVGKAVGNNPLALIIPCHRIVGHNNHLTGFRSGLPRKKWLLQHERSDF